MTSPMQAILEKQRASFTAAMPESMAVRKDRIARAVALLIDHKDAFAQAVSADFGHRSHEQTLMTDIMPSVSAMKHAAKHMESWARDQKRKPTFPLGFIGARASGLSTQGRCWYRRALEFPRWHGDGAIGGRVGSGQPRDGQAVRIYRGRIGIIC